MNPTCRHETVNLTKQGLKLSDLNPRGTFGAAEVYGHLVALDGQPAAYYVQVWLESGEDWEDVIGDYLAEGRRDPKGPIHVEFVRDGVLRSVVAVPRYRADDPEVLDLGATVSSALTAVHVQAVEACESEEARSARLAREAEQARRLAACESMRQTTLTVSVVGGVALALGAGAMGYFTGRGRAK